MVQHFSFRDTVGDHISGILFSFFVLTVTLICPESRVQVIVNHVAVGISLSNLFRRTFQFESDLLCFDSFGIFLRM